MRKTAFFSIVALALMGCGGGSGTGVDASPKNRSDTSPSLDQETNGNKTSDLKSTLSAPQKPDATASTATNPYPAPPVSEEEISHLLHVINVARAEGQDCGKIDSNGMPVKDSNGHYVYDGSNIIAPTTPLKWNDALYTAAYEHSDDLAKSDTASHSGSGTLSDWTGMDMDRRSTFVDRARNNGYQFINLGENISMGTYRDNIEKAVKSWLKSPGHCVNLMNPSYTEVGVGYVSKEGTTYGNYWTQVLGRPVK